MIGSMNLFLVALTACAPLWCMEEGNERPVKKPKITYQQELTTLAIPQDGPERTAALNLIENSLVLKKSFDMQKNETAREAVNRLATKKMNTPGINSVQLPLLLEMARHFNEDFYVEDRAINDALRNCNVSEIITIAEASEAIEVPKLRARALEFIGNYTKSDSFFTDASKDDLSISLLLSSNHSLKNALKEELAPLYPKVLTVGDKQVKYDLFAFSPDNRFIAMVPCVQDQQGVLTLWDLINNKKILDYTTPSRISTLAFVPKIGKCTLLLGTKRGDLIKYNMQSAKTKHIAGPDTPATSDIDEISVLKINDKKVTAGTRRGRFIIDLSSWKVIRKETNVFENADLYLAETPENEIRVDNYDKSLSLVFHQCDETDDVENGYSIYDEKMGKSETYLLDHRCAARFSDNSSYLAIASNEDEGGIQIRRTRFKNLQEAIGVLLLKKAHALGKPFKMSPLIKSLFDSFTYGEKKSFSERYNVRLD